MTLELRRVLRIRPHRIAAPAPAERIDDRPRQPMRAEVEAACIEWGQWCARRVPFAPRPLRSVIGRLRMPSATGDDTGRNMRLSAELAGFNLALIGLGERPYAVLYGLYAVRNGGRQGLPVKVIAGALGVHRATVYRERDSAAAHAWARRFEVLNSPALAPWLPAPAVVAEHATKNHLYPCDKKGQNSG